MLLTVSSLLISPNLIADPISTINKYAYAENAGWLDFSSIHEQVTVYNDHLEGYVWSEAVGWIHFQNSTPAYKAQQLVVTDTTPDNFSFNDQNNVTRGSV